MFASLSLCQTRSYDIFRVAHTIMLNFTSRCSTHCTYAIYANIHNCVRVAMLLTVQTPPKNTRTYTQTGNAVENIVGNRGPCFSGKWQMHIASHTHTQKCIGSQNKYALPSGRIFVWQLRYAIHWRRRRRTRCYFECVRVWSCAATLLLVLNPYVLALRWTTTDSVIAGRVPRTLMIRT